MSLANSSGLPKTVAASFARSVSPNAARTCSSSLAIRTDYLMPQLVGFNDVGAQFPQRVRDKALATGHPAGEPGNQQPVRRSAASIVFRISIAIVSGPTPPGTGV